MTTQTPAVTALDPNRKFYRPEDGTGMVEYAVMYREGSDLIERWSPAPLAYFGAQPPRRSVITDKAVAEALRDQCAADVAAKVVAATASRDAAKAAGDESDAADWQAYLNTEGSIVFKVFSRAISPFTEAD